MNRTFDRRPSDDPRSGNYPVRTLVAAKPIRSYTWGVPFRLNQGEEGACVGFAWASELGARPKVHTKVEPADARGVYFYAQTVDEFPETPPEQGTSVRAGAEAAQDYGYLGEYRWCWTILDLALSVGYLGPVVMGLDWYNGMMKPGPTGYIAPTGDIVGGHAILCNSVGVRKTAQGNPYIHDFGLINSWGREWGKDGGCRISAPLLEQLLLNNGEACVPVQRKWVPTLK